jgi:hypothetical protein
MTDSKVPVTITREAAARVAELGMQAELEQMLERARQVVPGLTGLHVGTTEPYDTGIEPGIGIEATTDQVWGPSDTTWKEYSRWKTTTFPPEVCLRFTLFLTPGTNHAG